MNEDLYRALVDLGVFPQPAEDLAHIYDGGEYLTQKVLTAFLGHVRETDNIAIAVWRLRHRILTTGGAARRHDPPARAPARRLLKGRASVGRQRSEAARHPISRHGPTT